MSSNISSFHKHDIKIRNVSHFDLRWYYQLIHLWNGTPPCIFIVIWSQIKSFYSSCYTIQSICILSSYQNNAVNVFFLIFGGISGVIIIIFFFQTHMLHRWGSCYRSTSSRSWSTCFWTFAKWSSPKIRWSWTTSKIWGSGWSKQYWSTKIIIN